MPASGDADPVAVVGVGASAGGLSALRDLFEGIPADTGLSFVVVVHLAPDHESHLADLLQPHCAMPVRQVTETIPLLADHVYVIPPGCNLAAVDTHLRLSDLEADRGSRNPIDHFFHTLAGTHDGNSIGVVLTGTGSDGTSGLTSIRTGGGLTIVQDPDEAEYDGMPRSALLGGAVDLVKPLAGIAEQLVGYSRHLPPMAADHDMLTDDERGVLSQIYAQIRDRTGHDATGYKVSTILRRIRRRMHLHQLTEVGAYLELLRADPGEVDLLFSDVLISVTSFFRDPEVFEALTERVVPAMFADRRGHDTVRVWSVGCATGEEAYSLGILMLEHAATLVDPPTVQIFASDLHEPSLQRAREGTYPASIETDVSAERLGRFFVRGDGTYRVRQELREIVVFAPHGLLRDPPFSHMDLIVCRNLLIYLQRDAQSSAATVFHYALEPGGHLLLGSSETLDRSDLFTTIDKHLRLFRRREGVGTSQVPTFMAVPSHGARRTSVAQSTRPATSDGHAAVHARLLDHVAPPSLLIDGDNRIVHFSEFAGRYVTQPGGTPTADVFQLVPDDLRLELRTAVHAARTEQQPSAGPPVTTTIDGTEQRVVVRAVPAVDDELDGFVLVIFDETVASEEAVADVGGRDLSVLQGLERQLDLTRRRLQTVIEEYETGQEEMRVSNEELQSTNEELRSTMEELETSREELQSMNEELATLNQENRHKVDELGMLSSDLQNLLHATDIATLFLDRNLRIVRFTPPVADFFNITANDRGRPLTDFTHRLRRDGLSIDAQRVLDRLIPIEYEIQTSGGRWLLTRLLPYRTTDDRIDGVVITFVDITRRFEAESSLRASERRLRMSLDASAMGTWTWDPASGTGTADDHARSIVGLPPASGLIEWLRAHVDGVSLTDLERLLDTDDRVRRQFTIDRTDGVAVVIELTAGPSVGDDPDHLEVIGTIADVTDTVGNSLALTRQNERLSLLSEAATQLLRGAEPANLIERLFPDIAAVLDVAMYERFELDDADAHGRRLGEEAVAARDRVVRNDLADSPDPAVAELRAAGLTAYACFPVLIGSDVRGILGFGLDHGRQFDQDTLAVLQTIVDYVALADQRLGTESELRDLNQNLESTVERRTAALERRDRQLRDLTTGLVRAEQQERERIAQVLHDDLQQLLYSAQMRLGLIDDELGPLLSEPVSGHLAEIGRYLDDGVALARGLSVDLAPQVLDEEDFGEVIRWLAHQMSEMHQLSVDIDMARPTVVPDPDLRIMLYQTIRELLFNVVKHADTDGASITIASGPDELDVEVSDGGRGFDVALLEDPARQGRGLLHIQHRLDLLGGDLRVESIPGDGTRVTLRFPHGAVTVPQGSR